MPPGPPPPASGAVEPLGPIGPRAVLIPVKAFAQAKRRLGLALGPEERAALARAMADRVVDAAAPLPVAVVCDDPEVAAWARGRDAVVVWEPGRGLNGAVEVGVAELTAAGAELVVVAHADLPRATDLASVGTVPGVTLVPDRTHDGTNVLALPTGTRFRFAYGPGSFERHRAEATRCGLAVTVLDRPDLAWDIDEPEDVVPVDRIVRRP